MMMNIYDKNKFYKNYILYDLYNLNCFIKSYYFSCGVAARGI